MEITADLVVSNYTDSPDIGFWTTLQKLVATVAAKLADTKKSVFATVTCERLDEAVGARWYKANRRSLRAVERSEGLQ